MFVIEEKPLNEDALWTEEDMQPQYGPSNNWYHTGVGDVQDSGECGYNEGQQACNFTMVDQYGDDVELFQFGRFFENVKNSNLKKLELKQKL